MEKGEANKSAKKISVGGIIAIVLAAILVVGGGFGGTKAVGLVGQLKSGAGQLYDGSGQIDDGAQQLNDGVIAYTDGVIQLADGCITLNDGVDALVDGGNQLKDGADQLADGSQQIADGVKLLGENSATLRNGSQTVADGVAQLGANSATLRDTAVQLKDGAQAFVDGLADEEKGMPYLSASLGQLADGAKRAANMLTGTTEGEWTTDNPPTINDLFGAVAGGAAGLDDAIAMLTAEELAGLDSTKWSESNIPSIKEINTVINNGLGSMVTGAEQLSTGVAATKTQVANVLGTDNANALAAVGAIQAAVQAGNLDASVLQTVAGMYGTLAALNGEFDVDQDGQISDADKAQSNILAQYATAAANVKVGATSLQGAVALSDQVAAGVATELAKGQVSLLTVAATGLAVSQGIADGLVLEDDNVTDGNISLVEGLVMAQAGVDSVVPSMEEGLATYQGLFQQYIDQGINAYTAGVDTLAANYPTLNEGIKTYTGGVDTVAANYPTLNNGIKTLQGGIGTAVDGIGTLKDGSKQLADGGQQLKDNTPTLVDGMATLAGGTTTLKDGLATLVTSLGGTAK